MQLSQKDENQGQAPIIQAVLRPAPVYKQQEMLGGATSAIYLNDGNTLQRFDYGPNCQELPVLNHLLRVNYHVQNETKVIFSYDMPSIDEIANFYGFTLHETEREEYENWKRDMSQIRRFSRYLSPKLVFMPPFLYLA